MAMIRPSGKPLKIAMRVVPGLKAGMRTNAQNGSKGVPKDDVELKIAAVNESPRRLRDGRRLQPRQL